MTGLERPSELADWWDRTVVDTEGHVLGRVEAIGCGRDRVIRRIGIRDGGGPALRFVSIAYVHVHGDHLVIDQDSGTTT